MDEQEQVPPELRDRFDELSILRKSNQEKVQQIVGQAQTDIVAQASMIRANMLAEVIFPDDATRIDFELSFEKAMSPLLDHYVSSITRQRLTQGMGEFRQG